MSFFVLALLVVCGIQAGHADEIATGGVRLRAVPHIDAC